MARPDPRGPSGPPSFTPKRPASPPADPTRSAPPLTPVRPTSLLKPTRIVAWSLLVTLAMALLTFAYKYLDDVARGESRPAAAPLLEELTGHLGGALILIPLVLWSRQIGFAGWRWPARAAWHGAGIVVYSALHTTLNWLSREALFPLFGLGDYDYGRLPVRYAMELPKDVSTYVLVFVVMALFERYRAARDAEVRARDLEARLARAQLENLQAQLNPHFIFNALNTISAVMYEDVARADRMLVGLSELMRRALAASHRQEVTLAEELQVLEAYREIMRARFGDRLQFDLDVDDGLATALVPTLILQPLVENAIRHGAPTPPEPARIEVRVRREGDTMLLEVEDNGPGASGARSPDAARESTAVPSDGASTAMSAVPGEDASIASPGRQTAGQGIGLRNTAERLRALYGASQSMALGTGRLGGMRVSILIPYRARPDEVAPEDVPADDVMAEEAWTGSAS